jgi:hypothetical protein
MRPTIAEPDSQRSLHPGPIVALRHSTRIPRLSHRPTLLILLLAAAIVVAPRTATSRRNVFAADADLPTADYYVVTGIDPRLCPSPTCGGVFVSLVNRSSTRFADGTVAARGGLRIVTTSFGPLPSLVATEAWRGMTGNLAMKPFYAVRSTGIVCITSPCPSFRARLLNELGRPLRRPNLHELDLAASGATSEQTEAGFAALFGGESLLTG